MEKIGEFLRLERRVISTPKSKEETWILKRKMEGELDEVRKLIKRIEGEEVRDTSNVGHGSESGQKLGKMSNKIRKKCSSLLDKLLKHKIDWLMNKHGGFLFLRIDENYTFIKSKLNRNEYRSPEEFALDVRLAFNNAKARHEGSDVSEIVEKLSQMFEEKWAAIEADYRGEMFIQI